MFAGFIFNIDREICELIFLKFVPRKILANLNCAAKMLSRRRAQFLRINVRWQMDEHERVNLCALRLRAGIHRRRVPFGRLGDGRGFVEKQICAARQRGHRIAHFGIA